MVKHCSQSLVSALLEGPCKEKDCTYHISTNLPHPFSSLGTLYYRDQTFLVHLQHINNYDEGMAGLATKTKKPISRVPHHSTNLQKHEGLGQSEPKLQLHFLDKTERE